MARTHRYQIFFFPKRHSRPELYLREPHLDKKNLKSITFCSLTVHVFSNQSNKLRFFPQLQNWNDQKMPNIKSLIICSKDTLHIMDNWLLWQFVLIGIGKFWKITCSYICTNSPYLLQFLFLIDYLMFLLCNTSFWKFNP